MNVLQTENTVEPKLIIILKILLFGTLNSHGFFRLINSALLSRLSYSLLNKFIYQTVNNSQTKQVRANLDNK